jgi:GTP-sensing pleiotropic transcriptional regulator CodY
MEILREKHSEVEKEARDKAAITMAINSLSLLRYASHVRFPYQ